METAVYLVMEPNLIIASDLALNVQDFAPSAIVLAAGSQVDACLLLQNHARVRLAFVHMDPVSFASSDLAVLLAHRQATLVFIGDAAERHTSGHLVLERPFTLQTTAALMQVAEAMDAL